MSLVQRKLVKQFDQTRGIFDLFIYKPDNGDTIDDMLESGYFSASRYLSEPDWNGGIIQVVDTNGRMAYIVIDASGVPVSSVLAKVQNANYDTSKYEEIDNLNALPAPVAGVITLDADKAYKFIGNVDLLGNRLVTSGVAAITGTTSETTSLTSTGLNPAEYLIITDYRLPMQNILIKDVSKAVGVNLLGASTDPNLALDWTAVNFSGCDVNVRAGNIDNLIMTDCAILGSGTMQFFGTVGTIGFQSSIFTGDGSAYPIIDIESTATITRRIRSIYSAFVAFGSTNAINVDPSASIPNQAYILDTVSFSGGGTYLTGITSSSNKASFTDCTGISNSSEISQYYMNGNAVATTIAATGAPVKIAGVTTSAAVTSKFVNTDNRSTYIGSRTRLFKITATLSVSSGNGHQIGVYIAKNGVVIDDSEIYGTTNAGGRSENISVQTFTELSENDYIEIWCENNTAIVNVTATDLNVAIS